ncbi:MAG TPA: hypothetical protein PLF40_16195 [Kofleriaceae bacterium]|nr:hypothetical protein [Kofleriaceae bacterium]
MGLRLHKATFRLGYAASLVMLGCGPKVNVATNPFDEDLHANAKEYERPASAPPSTAAPRTKLREGKIKRSALLAVLDAGPAAFLHDIDMVALHDEQNFHGWQLKQITSPSSPAALADLALDDVVQAVNNMPIGRPDQWMTAWQALRTAPRLVIDLDRGGQQYLLQFDIENDVVAPAVPAPTAK